MVNRKEVDFALGMNLGHNMIGSQSVKIDNKKLILGPFFVNTNRLQGVDFTTPMLTMSHGLVIPIRPSINLAAITDALELKVWLVILITMPVYITIMVMANREYFGDMKWEVFAAFVIRTSVMEQRVECPPATRLYQKMLMLFWIVPLFVLITGYVGNMTALITKPTLQKPIKDIYELVNQNDIHWMIEKGSSIVSYLEKAPPGTVFTIGFV